MIFDNLVIHNVISLLVLPKFENVRDAPRSISSYFLLMRDDCTIQFTIV